jgi:hypothetical protein
MLGTPQYVKKEDAAWVIGSTYRADNGREAVAQNAEGLFYYMWADLDKGNAGLSDVVNALRKVFPDGEWLVYSTKSSEPENRKWRIMVRMAVSIVGRAYAAYQQGFNEALTQLGLHPDSSSISVNRICFLPNRGAHYETHYHEGRAVDLTDSWFTKRATEIYQDFLLRDTEYQKRRTETSRIKRSGHNSHIDAFRAENPPDQLLERLGFVTRNGISWHHPQLQVGHSFATDLYADGGIFTLSSSIGGPTAAGGHATNGGWYFNDGYDLARYIWFAKGKEGDNQMKAIAGQMRDKRQDYFLAHGRDQALRILPSMEAAIHKRRGNSLSLVQWSVEAQAADLDRAQKESLELAALQKRAETDRIRSQHQLWGGDWMKQVPFEFDDTVNEWEWLAWHAPGVLGKLVRDNARFSAKATLVPSLVGALGVLAHRCQGKFVMGFSGHITPPSLPMLLIGNSGTGKADANKLFRRVNKYHELPAADSRQEVRMFASGAAVTRHLSQYPNTIVIDSEYGAGQSAMKGNSNGGHHDDERAKLTDAMSAFVEGLGASKNSDSGKSTPAVHNPCISAILSSTPERFAEAFSERDAEGGFLGRFVSFAVSDPQNLPKRDRGVFAGDIPEDVRLWLDYIESIAAPQTERLPAPTDPDGALGLAWRGQYRCFHMLVPDAEAAVELGKLIARMDKERQRAIQSGERTRAHLMNRGPERVSRLSLIAALAQLSPSRPPVITADCVRWANSVVMASINHLSATSNSGDDDNYVSMCHARIKDMFRRIEEDPSFAASLGSDCRKVDVPSLGVTRTEVKRFKLRSYIRRNKAAAYVCDRELDSLVEERILLCNQEVVLGKTVTYYSLIGRI